MAVERKRKKEVHDYDTGDNEVQSTIPAKKHKMAVSDSVPEPTESLEPIEMSRGAIVQGKGRKRKRKKGYFNELFQQMEFYFGDSNMSKSKFMNEMTSKTEGGWIDLDIFLRFNKIAEMMKTFFGRLHTEDLWNAISFGLVRNKDDGQENNNNLLQIRETEGGVKQVRRSKPLQLKAGEDVEKSTIYIENVPSFVTNDSLKKMFTEKCGIVDYVSLPRYKHNRAVKGFAFIEFANISGAEAAMKMFDQGNVGAVKSEHPTVKDSQILQPLEMDPAQLQSIKSFQVEKSIEAGIELSTCRGDSGQSPKTENDNTELHIKQESFKRKNGIDEKNITKKAKKHHKDNDNIDLKTQDNESLKTEKQNCGGPEILSKDVAKENAISPKNNNGVKKDDDMELDKTKKDDDVQIDENVKKRKKRHKNKKVRPYMQAPQGNSLSAPDGYMNNELMPPNGGSSDDYVLSVLRIMKKEEWRRMRNKYLNLQKQNMSVAKKRIHQMRTTTKEKHKEVHPSSVHAAYPSQTPSLLDTPVNINEEHKNKYEFVPGIIVRFKLEDPIVDQGKQIKSRLRAAVMEPVKYVDAANGRNEVYVRCCSQKQAETLISAKGLMGNSNGEILTGEEESAYWNKIRSDREDKISGKVKVISASKKERGKDRVVKKYEQEVRNTHKFFDEGVDE